MTLYNNSDFVQYLVSVDFIVSAPLLLLILSFQLAFCLLDFYSRCTSGIILSSPLHLEHWWSGYLCPIILQYLVSSPSEINPIKYVHLGGTEILIKACFREGIDTPIELYLADDRIIKKGFISDGLLTRYCKIIGHKYPDHQCSRCNGEDNIIPEVHLE